MNCEMWTITKRKGNHLCLGVWVAFRFHEVRPRALGETHHSTVLCHTILRILYTNRQPSFHPHDEVKSLQDASSVMPSHSKKEKRKDPSPQMERGTLNQDAVWMQIKMKMKLLQAPTVKINEKPGISDIIDNFLNKSRERVQFKVCTDQLTSKENRQNKQKQTKQTERKKKWNETWRRWATRTLHN